MSSGWNAFCNSHGSDNLFVNDTVLERLECFQKVLLVWIPCGFLWLFAPLEVFYIHQNCNGTVPWSVSNIAKMVLAVLMAVTCLVLEVREIYWWIAGDPTASILDQGILFKMITVILALILSNYGQQHGIQYSCILFSFWLLAAISAMINYWTILMAVLQGKSTDVFSFVFYSIYFPLVTAEMILSGFLDTPSTHRRNPKLEGKENHEGNIMSSCASTLLYTWFDSIAYHSDSSCLSHDLLSRQPLSWQDKTRQIMDKFDRQWSELIKKHYRQRPSHKLRAAFTRKYGVTIQFTEGPHFRPSFSSVLLRMLGSHFLISLFLRLVSDLLLWVNPIVLGYLLCHSSVREGLGCAGVFCLANLVQAAMECQTSHIVHVVALRLKVTAIASTLRKVLNMPRLFERAEAKRHVINLVTIEANHLLDAVRGLPLVITTPLHFVFAFYFLANELGQCMLLTAAVLVITLFCRLAVELRANKDEVSRMQSSETRLKLLNGILKHFKELKLYAWEEPFGKAVNTARELELRLRMRMLIWHNLGNCVMLHNTWVAFIAVASCALLDSVDAIAAEKLFPIIAVVHIIWKQMGLFSKQLVAVLQGWAAFQQLDAFLNLQDLLLCRCSILRPEKSKTKGADYPIDIKDGTFTWRIEKPCVLKGVNFRVAEGSLVAIVGPSGSGKTSLIHALLREMITLNGYAYLKGRTAYVPQIPWLRDSTLRENIMFGHLPNDFLYERVIDACLLKPILDRLRFHDLTDIQEADLDDDAKQRISIARAMYSNPDIYLFDEPFSCMNLTVTRDYIFDNVLGPKGALVNKTRILTTKDLSHLPFADVVVVMANGTIVETGPYREFVERGHEVHLTNRTCPLKTDPEDSEETGDEEEERMDGYPINLPVSSENTYQAYKHYLSSSSLTALLATLIGVIGTEAALVGSYFKLREWSDDPVQNEVLWDVGHNLGLYTFLTALQVGCLVVSGACWTCFSIGAARALHHQLLWSVLGSRVCTRGGSAAFARLREQLLECFRSAIDSVDSAVPLGMGYILGLVGLLIAHIVVLIICLPFFILFALPIILVSFFVRRYFVRISTRLTEQQRLVSQGLCPLFLEVIDGSSVIRAFGRQAEFSRDLERLMDLSNSHLYLNIISNGWMAIRMKFLGVLVIVCTALLITFTRESLTTGYVGLSICSALIISDILHYLTALSNSMEKTIASVANIKTLSDIPTENMQDLWGSFQRLPDSWPEEGAICFDNYTCSTRIYTEPLLTNVCCYIYGGEKIAVINREEEDPLPGIILALFKMMEIEAGRILVDGIDISTVGLHDLRSRFALIPKDPVIFPGTLRDNLDPCNLCSDSDIWRILQLVRLREFTLALPDGLFQDLTNETWASALRESHRRRLCLARALLRRPKVMVYHEPPTSSDPETDDLIQAILRSKCVQSTVLIITQKKKTILESTRTLVLEDSRLKEFDIASNLLLQQDSVLHKIAKQEGWSI